MADQDPKKAANGDPEPAKDDEAPAEDEANRNKGKLTEFRQLCSMGLECVGLLVFAVTAIGTILFIAGFNFFAGDPDISFYRHLRSVELMLTLAATGLVVAIIGRVEKPNPFVLTFGILLIGALIVPSNDIVRFALIATGSDKSYASFFQSGRSGSDLAGRSTDVANKILTELNQAGFTGTLAPERRKVAVDIIESEVKKEREITLLDQVRSRGAMETLQATTSDLERWIYKYSAKEKFIDDLRYLRSENLISFPYDDVDSIAITQLGRTVLERKRIEDASLSTSGSLACPPGAVNAPDVTTALLSSEGQLTPLRQDFDYVRFLVNDPADYLIKVIAQRSEATEQEEQDTGTPDLEADTEQQDLEEYLGFAPLDPFLQVIRQMDDGTCVFLFEDDDSADNLNASLLLNLVEGTYLIGTRTISPTEGNATVFVTKEAS